MTQEDFTVIGAGLAGSEAALVLARAGARVFLYEQKPKYYSAAHKLPGAAELVCSNSFKSMEVTSAHGLLKEELRTLESPLLEIAYEARVPGGKALTIEREKFSQLVTERLQSHPRIIWKTEQVHDLDSIIFPCLVATGPLTSGNLIREISKICGDEGLYFYDATSPVVTLESLNLEKFFWGNRNEDGEDYLNLPLTKEEYLRFRDLLLGAEKMQSHIEGEELRFFEGCLPIEELAARGENTLAFSCMKPVGFERNLKKRAHAVIQFRRERAAGELLNLVGFQSRMKWPEQERVLRSLPGMENAEFVRLGAMHRNTFVNAPLHLDEKLSLKKRSNLFLAGQITGSEGYTEALSTGHYAALRMLGIPALPETTAIQSLVRYLVNADPRNFQPMNFNFGLLPPVEADNAKMKLKGKSARHAVRASRALGDLKKWKEVVSSSGFRAFSNPMSSPENSVPILSELERSISQS